VLLDSSRSQPPPHPLLGAPRRLDLEEGPTELEDEEGVREVVSSSELSCLFLQPALNARLAPGA